MSVVGLPIEKSSASMSVFNYDFKVPYYPESDECKVPYKATVKLQDMICMLLKIRSFTKNKRYCFA